MSTTDSKDVNAAIPSKTVEGRPLEVTVDERGLERAMRQLKRKVAAEGVGREMKRRRHYEKPSVRKRRKAREAERRRRRSKRRNEARGSGGPGERSGGPGERSGGPGERSGGPGGGGGGGRE
ncbi:MAG: 30S ribosomal protein S21 [Deltaproteobacteria bacterium]|nr:30S ribosomal protein S21 [Deltaproteobacteria bacterium]